MYVLYGFVCIYVDTDHSAFQVLHKPSKTLMHTELQESPMVIIPITKEALQQTFLLFHVNRRFLCRWALYHTFYQPVATCLEKPRESLMKPLEYVLIARQVFQRPGRLGTGSDQPKMPLIR